MTPDIAKIDVLVIGCGVSGLSSGIRLLEKKFPVTIIARDLPPDTTSDVPAAVWYPYICDTSISDEAYKKRVLEWGRVTYKEGYKLAKVPESGVSLVKFTRLFDKESESKFEEPWWRGDYLNDYDLVSEGELPPHYKDGKGYTLEAPLFETPTYMPYLVRRFKQSGGHIIKANVGKVSDLHDDNRLIVNCSGLGAKEIAEDNDVKPKRGQIIRVKASGTDGGLLDENPPDNSKIFGYVVPRPINEDCILGGTAEIGDYNLEPDDETEEEIKKKCRLLAPNLKILEVLGNKVGLRPEREQVRLERKPVPENRRCSVIHNYGHGGVGFTLAWGCARDVVKLAREFRALG